MKFYGGSMGNELGLKESFHKIMRAFGKYLKGEGAIFLSCIKGILLFLLLYIGFWYMGGAGNDETAINGEWLNRIITWIVEFIKASTTDSNGYNPIMVGITIFSVLAVVFGIVKFLSNVTKDRYDSMFLTITEQKTQNYFYGVITFLIFYPFGLLLVGLKILENVDKIFLFFEIFIVVFCAGLTIFSLFWGIHKRDIFGRAAVIAGFMTFIMAILGICCPVRKFYWPTVLLYALFIVFVALYLIKKFNTFFRNEETIYYFRKPEIDRMYVHYRLDDERMVCSPDSILKLNSEREIINIDKLSEHKLIKESVSIKSKGWSEFLNEIEDIYFLRTIVKYIWGKIKGIPRFLWNMIRGIFLHIKNAVCAFINKIVKRLSLIRMLFIKIQSLKKTLKSKDEELERVKKELAELKKRA